MTIFWDVLSQLLPSYGFTTINNPRPRYLLLDIPEKIKVTRAEVYKEYDYLFGLAFEEAQCNIRRIVELTYTLGYMDEQTLDSYLECIHNCIEQNTKENVFLLWLNL